MQIWTFHAISSKNEIFFSEVAPTSLIGMVIGKGEFSVEIWTCHTIPNKKISLLN